MNQRMTKRGAAGAAKPSITNRTGAARRSQEERSRDARAKLLKATIAVLVERGYGGLSTKEVAARAGLSSGALAHHFAAKADLVIAATTTVYEEAITRGQRVAMSVRAIRNPIRGFIEDCASVYFEWPFLAALEVLVAARSDAALMKQILPVMRRYREVTNVVWLDVFRRSAIPDAQCELLLNLTLNMVRGMAVNSLWQKDMKRYRAQLLQWERLVNRTLAAPAESARR